MGGGEPAETPGRTYVYICHSRGRGDIYLQMLVLELNKCFAVVQWNRKIKLKGPSHKIRFAQQWYDLI